MRSATTALLATVGLFAATPTLAATTGFASIDYSLSLTNPAGVFVDVYEDLVSSDSEYSGAGNASVSAEASDLSASISSRTEVAGIGTASSEADASSFFILENDSEDATTYFFDLFYDISAGAELAAPVDDAFAYAGLSIMDDFGSMLFEYELIFDTSNPGEQRFSGTERIEVALGGFDFNSVEVFAEVFSSSVSPIPLPAAGWLLLAGLGGLAAIRRRDV